MIPPTPAGPAPSSGYAFEGAPAPAQVVQRPLSEVLGDLPRQYRRVLTQPGAATFAAELEKAEWRSVWLQLLAWGILAALVGFIVWLIAPSPTPFSIGQRPSGVQVMTPGTPYQGQIISVPAGFFVWMGLLYLTAKLLFNGRGTFLQQSYASVLFQAPLGVLSAILAPIPVLGLISFAIFIYSIVLQVFAVVAAHRLGGGKATAVVLLPAVVIGLLICAFGIVFLGVLLGVLLS